MKKFKVGSLEFGLLMLSIFVTRFMFEAVSSYATPVEQGELHNWLVNSYHIYGIVLIVLTLFIAGIFFVTLLRYTNATDGVVKEN